MISRELALPSGASLGFAFVERPGNIQEPTAHDVGNASARNRAVLIGTSRNSATDDACATADNGIRSCVREYQL
jgi:hypothetical protein